MQTIFVSNSVSTGLAPRKSLLKRRRKALSDGGTKPTADEIVFSDTPGIVDDGNFAYGVCHVCEWQGAARRARSKARRDAAEHYLLAH